jgi:LacI family transcriptional regulator
VSKEIAHTENLLSKQVDGIIYAAAGFGTDHIKMLIRQRLPVVLIERAPRDAPVDAVLISNHLGGQLAAYHLLELGHRRIACITGPRRVTLREERLHGFRTTLARSGVVLDDCSIRVGDFKSESGYRHALSLLVQNDRPTAIFAFNDMMALGVLRAAHELDIAVPQQLSVIGFDDTYLASFSVPTLTTITLPKHEMGLRAMQMLLDRINNPERPPEKVLFDIELTIRNSTARFPAS